MLNLIRLRDLLRNPLHVGDGPSSQVASDPDLRHFLHDLSTPITALRFALALLRERERDLGDK